MKDKKERVTLRRVVWKGGKAGIPGRKNNVCEGTEEGNMMCQVLPVVWFFRIMQWRRLRIAEMRLVGHN